MTGIIKSIGVSNFNVKQLTSLLEGATVRTPTQGPSCRRAMKRSLFRMPYGTRLTRDIQECDNGNPPRRAFAIRRAGLSSLPI